VNRLTEPRQTEQHIAEMLFVHEADWQSTKRLQAERLPKQAGRRQESLE